MLAELFLGPLIYGLAVGTDYRTSRAALRNCSVCYETNASPINVSRPGPAVAVAAGLSVVDYGLGRSKSKFARSARWGMRFGTVLVFGLQAKANRDISRRNRR